MTAVPFRRRLVARSVVTSLIALVVSRGEAVAQRIDFTLGSPAAEVRRAQGVPAVIERLHSLGLEIWTFGAATVRLSSDSMRVIGWDDAARTLHVSMRRRGLTRQRLRRSASGRIRMMSRGSWGRRCAVREDRAHGTMSWRYGASAVTICAGEPSRARLGERRRESPRAGLGNWRRASRRKPRSVRQASWRSLTRQLTLDMTVDFREPSGNGALDGGEAATVVVEVRNRGPGAGNGVRVVATSESSERGVVVGASPCFPASTRERARGSTCRSLRPPMSATAALHST